MYKSEKLGAANASNLIINLNGIENEENKVGKTVELYCSSRVCYTHNRFPRLVQSITNLLFDDSMLRYPHENRRTMDGNTPDVDCGAPDRQIHGEIVEKF